MKQVEAALTRDGKPTLPAKDSVTLAIIIKGESKLEARNKFQMETRLLNI